MAQSRDISSRKESNKIRSAISIALLFSMLSGCSIEHFDAIRPELNHENALIIYPEMFSDEYTSLISSDGTNKSEDAEINSGGSVSLGNMNAATNIEPLAQDIIASSDYSKYMESIYDQLLEKLKSSGANMDKLYLRTFHYGYNQSADPSIENEMVIASTHNMQHVGNLDYVMGSAIPRYALAWLGRLGSNPTAIQIQRNSALNKTNEWLDIELREAAFIGSLKPTSLPDSNWADLKYIWSLPKYADMSVTEFRNELRGNAAETIPNLNLSYTNVYGKSSTITVNDTNTSLGFIGMHKTEKSEVDKLFTAYNQFPTCINNYLDFYSDDPNCLMFSHMTGHTRTLVIVGAELPNTTHTTLEQMLGTSYSAVQGIVNNIIPCTAVSDFKTKINSNATTVVKESKEVR